MIMINIYIRKEWRGCWFWMTESPRFNHMALDKLYDLLTPFLIYKVKLNSNICILGLL